jgi:hypothetical protein
MKWFVIVLMVGTYSDGSKDVFWYNKNNFPTVEDCHTFVYDNASLIGKHMTQQFGPKPIERVYCVREDKLELFGLGYQI